MLYAFGEWPPPREGRMVLPGECSVTSNSKKRVNHPCARNEDHALWVMKWWTDEGDLVFDAFAGTGTTGVAAVRLGRRFAGCEVDPAHFALAVERISDELIKRTSEYHRNPDKYPLLKGSP